MGRSGKKVKSDKINALRKQYDAFLEEDKKRKDRNEFILGCLEDMRLSNTVSVPIHQQKIQFMRDYYTFPQISYISKSDCVNHKQLRADHSISVSPYNENLEETFTFKEISTKYILIPKLQSTFQRKTTLIDSPKANITDTDWKTKYNILDELKKNEKGTTNDENNEIADLHKDINNMLYTDVPLDTIHKENPLPDSNGKTDHKRHKNEVRDAKMDQSERNESLNISPENQDIIQNNAKYIKNTIENVKDSKLIFDPYEKETILHEEIYDSKEQMKEKSLTDRSLIKLHSTANEQEQITEIKETKDYSQEKDQQSNLVNEMNEEISEAPVSGAQGDDNFNTYKHGNSFENYEVNEITKRNQKTNEEIYQELKNTNTRITELTREEELEDNSKDIFLNDTEEYKADEEFDSKKLSNDEVGEVVEDQDNHISNEYVAYATEKEDYINISNQINNEPQAYSTGNENHTNEEYTYYDESHQQPYTSEINEHEESSERYDPSYEQQYANNYEDPNMAQYQNKQYVMENTYEQQDTMENTYEQQDTMENTYGQQDTIENTYEQQDTDNIIYDNQNEGDINYGYDNSENIGIIDQSQPEIIYNYENEIIDNQQYNSNEQQEYPVIHNEQYGHQQEYNESELTENALEADSGLTENVAGSVNDTVKTINNTKEISDKVQSDVTLP